MEFRIESPVAKSRAYKSISAVPARDRGVFEWMLSSGCSCAQSGLFTYVVAHKDKS